MVKATMVLCMVEFLFCTLISVVQFLRSRCQIVLASLSVSGRRVQALVAENLRQSDQIVAGVFKVTVGHRMPKQVGMQLHTDQGRILAAQIPHATVRERASLADEDEVALNWRASLQVNLSTLGEQGVASGTASLLAAFAISEDDRAAALAKHQVAEFQSDQIADPSSR